MIHIAVSHNLLHRLVGLRQRTFVVSHNEHLGHRRGLHLAGLHLKGGVDGAVVADGGVLVGTTEHRVLSKGTDDEGVVDNALPTGGTDVFLQVSQRFVELKVARSLIEGTLENGEVVNQADLTSDQMRTKLASDYPFAITFSVSSVSLEAETGDASFVTQISWPYESGDDEEDTLWGNMAYTFKQAHPNDPCISLRVKIYITQAANQPSNNNEPEEPEP